jgi:hypothetical protein
MYNNYTYNSSLQKVIYSYSLNDFGLENNSSQNINYSDFYKSIGGVNFIDNNAEPLQSDDSYHSAFSDEGNDDNDLKYFDDIDDYNDDDTSENKFEYESQQSENINYGEFTTKFDINNIILDENYFKNIDEKIDNIILEINDMIQNFLQNGGKKNFKNKYIKYLHKTNDYG